MLEEIHYTYQEQFRKCNKAACNACKQGPGHGPYWYAYWRENDMLHSRYVGKQKREIHTQRAPEVYDKTTWEEIKAHYNYTCLCCHRKEPEITLVPDHIIPKSKGGKTVKENIQPLCKHCNARKGKRSTDYRLPQESLWEVV